MTTPKSASRPVDPKSLVQAAAKLGTNVTMQDKSGRLQILVELKGGRTQVVFVTTESDAGATLGRLTTGVAPARNLGAERASAALAMNARLRFGCLAIVNDELSMTDTFMPSHTTPQELLNVILFLAESADRYEKGLAGGDER